ncbi:FixH protein [Neolewinella xylanilytica]|uniref:FixH protein n=1 Tax=Neolewinella xylanilytica TaxID=1514080 RepID=A0A2S6I7X8_9BACT|nr:FixH family protein [Neolewinella xylanilytica]PPK87600.1 FixH protein [Neolewinella xylanilytica]
MTIHWGHGIALFYSFFVCTLVVVVIKSMGFDNSLVTEAYYQRDINYQQEYERRSNSRTLAEPLRLEHHRLEFPDYLAPEATGTLLLYRPSSKRYDRTVRLDLDAEGGMDLPVAGLPGGRYVAIVEWEAAGRKYYDELDLDL